MTDIENRRSIVLNAINELEKLYPDARCSLTYSKPYELLIAARLSAQCTDARVNMVTPRLFERFPTLEAFASSDLTELEELICSCGLYHTKAISIRAMAQMLIADFGGELPDSLEKLLLLPGVGRKTANLIMGDVFGKSAIVTDTHCIRICGRLGLSDGKDPLATERSLAEILPPEKSSDFCHRLVLFGREVCIARNPHCESCQLSGFCQYFATR